MSIQEKGETSSTVQHETTTTTKGTTPEGIIPEGTTNAPTPPRKPLWRRILSIITKVFVAFVVLGIVGVLSFAALIYYLNKQLPSNAELHNYTYNTPSVIYDRNGEQIGLLGTFKREPVPLEAINTCLINATIAIEDERFYEHQGFDLRAILRAAKADIAARSVVEGASTLDQQVARNLFLTRDQTIIRKLKEVIIAYRMGKVLSKDEIITLYLNVVPYGRGAYGIQAAAENYYGKDNTELTISECATIAGLPQAPSYIAPHLSIERATARRNRVLTRMFEDDYITENEYSEAITTEITIIDKVEPRRKYANYFVDYVITELKRVANITDYLDNGYTIHTTLSLNLQEKAENAVELNLIDLAKRQGFTGELSRFSYEEATQEVRNKLEEIARNNAEEGGEAQTDTDTTSNTSNTALDVDAMALTDKKQFNTAIDAGQLPTAELYTDTYKQTVHNLYYEQLTDVPSYLTKRGAEKALVISLNRTFARVLPLNNTTVNLLVNPNINRGDKIRVIRGNSMLIPFSSTRWAANSSDKIAGRAFSVSSMLQVLETKDIIYITPTNKLYNPQDNNSEYLAYLFQEPTAEGAMLSVNKNNEIVAMVGGFNYYKSVYNRAYQSYRQMGSAFKPIVYATAIENGYAFADYVDDIPIIKEGQNNTTWKPSNYNEIFYGTTTFAEGLAKSRNTVTILLAEKLGLERILNMTKRFHFSSEMPNDLTVSIGAGSASVMEVATSFNVFNNLGLYQEPVAILDVWNSDGVLVYSASGNYDNTTNGDDELLATDTATIADDELFATDTATNADDELLATDTATNADDELLATDTATIADDDQPMFSDPNRILGESEAYEVLTVLEDVVNKGTAIALRSVGRPLAAKTGTTNDYRDAWFVGMFPNLLTVAWVGFDNFTTLGNAEYGARAALPAWRRYTSDILDELPYALFPLPTNATAVRYYKIDSNDYSISDSLVDDYYFSPFILDDAGKPIRKGE